MNKNILTAAASKTWLFALLLIIFGALWILPFMTVIPFLGDLIYGAVFMSLAFMAIYMRDAAYAFEGDERVALKDVAMGFGLMLMGLIVEDFGSFAMAIVWDLAFGVLFLLGGLKSWVPLENSKSPAFSTRTLPVPSNWPVSSSSWLACWASSTPFPS